MTTKSTEAATAEDRKVVTGSPDVTEPVHLGGGGFVEVDGRGVPLVLSRPKPRGLLPVPQEVEAVVAREEARLRADRHLAPTPEARRRMIDAFTLQYYYEGIDVAYRPTPRGVEILAVGPAEIGRLLQSLDADTRRGVKVGQP